MACNLDVSRGAQRKVALVSGGVAVVLWSRDMVFHPWTNETATWHDRATTSSAWPSDSASGAEPPDPHMPEIAFRNEARLRDPKPLSAAACRLFTQHTAGSRLCDALETWTLQDFSTTPHLNIHDRLPARCLQVAGIAIDDFHSGSRCVGGFARA